MFNMYTAGCAISGPCIESTQGNLKEAIDSLIAMPYILKKTLPQLLSVVSRGSNISFSV